MDITKMIALDRATVNDLALWLAHYIKTQFEKYPQARAAVMPHWGQMPTTQLAQSTWIVLIRDTPYAGWEYFDPPVQVDMNGHFASVPTRIGLRVEVFGTWLVVTGICKDNQALGFFAELMKAMEDGWPRVDDSQDAGGSPLPERRERTRLEVPDSTNNIEPIAAQVEPAEDAPKIPRAPVGRRRDPDNSWAYQQVNELGRAPAEVYPEWLQRRRDRGTLKQLDDSKDSFKHAIAERKK